MCMKPYLHLVDLEVDKYTNYFLNEFIPANKFNQQITNTNRYVQYELPSFFNNPVIKELEYILCTKYNFPSIQYFIIFKHLNDGQAIHIDGVQVPRYSSLNLPLSGYEKTKMAFYKVINDIDPVISNANYYSKNDVEQIDEFKCKNEWVLVNSGIPHNIQHIDKNNPRVTLCIRFKSNPTLSDLVNRINSSLPC